MSLNKQMKTKTPNDQKEDAPGNVTVNSQEKPDQEPEHVFCLDPHEQYFNYLAAVTITGNWTANLDLCIA
jgi:hypothetical protein